MKRYFEFVKGRAAKFWEIQVRHISVTIRSGRIGTTGKIKALVRHSVDEAFKYAQTLIAAKLKRGYRESASPFRSGE
jgi:predicted DNA-binding WGR domain protein